MSINKSEYNKAHRNFLDVKDKKSLNTSLGRFKGTHIYDSKMNIYLTVNINAK